jgi:hypothetical protein
MNVRSGVYLLLKILDSEVVAIKGNLNGGNALWVSEADWSHDED